MADKKVYGPRSRAKALKLIQKADKLLIAAKAVFDTVEVGDGTEDDAVSSDNYAIYEMFRRVGDMYRDAGSLVYHSSIDDPADIVDAMRKGISREKLAGELEEPGPFLEVK